MLGLLNAVWEPARARAMTERDDLQRFAQAKGENIAIEPWDWRHYAEQVRLARHDLDEAVIKTYFQLDRIIAAAFETAHRLFGLSFEELKDFPRYHPDVRAWRVLDANGAVVGTFLGDYFARESKRSGAWMSAFRSQEKLAGDIRPIIVNVMNFAKGGEGEPSLLSFDDARTLFHEFGHALHGLLSNVTYPLLAGTSVSTDFVELPSQLFEHWLGQPEILRRYATHYRTGEPIPEPLLQRLMAARNFNQGFATVEYLSSALVDIALHQRRRRRSARCGGFREGDAVLDRHAARDRHAASHAAFRPCVLGRRLFVGLLQLSVVGSARRGCVHGVRGNRRCLRSRDSGAFEAIRLFGRESA